MSSTHAWAERFIQQHDKTRPYAPENGEKLKFQPGERVIYTNDYGVEWEFTITALYQPPETTTEYARGGRYMLDKSSYWVPVAEKNLKPITQYPVISPLQIIL